MSEGRRGAFWEGGRLVWQRRGVLIGVHALSLFRALLATVPVELRMAARLDRSLAAQRLYSGFDLAVLAETVGGGEASGFHRDDVPAAIASALTFLAAMVFLTGGILAGYRTRIPPGPAEFFAACGAFFGRFLRLDALLLVTLPLVFGAARLVRAGSVAMAERSAGEALGRGLDVGRWTLLFLALMTVRLCFDMAQVHMVDVDQRAVRRALWSGSKIVLRNLGTLLWLELRINLLAWAGLALIAWAWVKHVRPEWVGAQFVLGQVAVAVWFGTRLWQRASETVW